MEFKVDKKETYTVFTVLEEKLNSLVAPELKTELTLLNTNGTKNVILDLGNVKFVDSSGLSAILVGNRLCQGSRGSMVITKLTGHVNKLIKISQLDTVLSITPTVPEARDLIMMDELMRELQGDESATSSEAESE